MELVLNTLEEWENQVLMDLIPPLPMEKQAKLIEKNYDFEHVPIKTSHWDEGSSKLVENVEDKTIVRIKDVVVKYRPNLHMGDFWVHVTIVNDAPSLRFYYLYKNKDEIISEYATHPHISDGVPCLGSYAAEIQTHWDNKNFLLFLQSIRNYLQSYNGRSTYIAGTHWRKKKICYQLHTPKEVKEIFSAESDDPESMDLISIGKDHQRWNFPKDIPCWGQFEVTGHISKNFNELFKTFEIPYLRTRHYQRQELQRFALDRYSFSHEKSIHQKILGYIYLAMSLGEMSFVESLYFNKIFLTKLYVDYDGVSDPEVLQALQNMSLKLDQVRRSHNYYWPIDINGNHNNWGISLSDAKDEIQDLDKLLKPYRATSTETDFGKSLKSAGSAMGQYLVMMRKGIPEKANARNWLTTLKDKSIDIDDVTFRYNKLKTRSLKGSLENLKKEERRMKRELKRTFTINPKQDAQQGSLFSTTE